ncbi:hypothetical protein AB0E69_17120 [Kribbella sp. NPDC026611]|uniref:hypothetical protein n=1 Tax=Kribbella sp. NPDC026611 TaxID=3154911 RepID=UPI0033F5724A
MNDSPRSPTAISRHPHSVPRLADRQFTSTPSASCLRVGAFRTERAENDLRLALAEFDSEAEASHR